MRRLVLLAAMALGACSERHGERAVEAQRLVFVHQPLGEPTAFAALLDEFRRAHPGVDLVTQVIPSSADVAHQFLLTALEGGAAELDVFVADVVWVPELAKAGWVADLSSAFPLESLRRELLEGPVEAVTVDGRVFAMPWYVDVGLLAYRTDLVPRAPSTYAELLAFAKAAQERDPTLRGYVWQGRQYEGLVCNAYEAIWGHGGEALRDGRLALDSAAARDGLGYLRGLITSGVSPASVTSASEEDSRRVFQAGRAVFMRNWPYVWAEGQKEGSPIRGRFALAPLPTRSGEQGWGTLGGWQLAVSARLPPARLALATELVRHLTSAHAAKRMAIDYGRFPARRDVYDDAAIREQLPLFAQLLPLLERARPRPVTAYYNLLSDVLQSELSAAIVGVRAPDEALARAQARADHLMAR